MDTRKEIVDSAINLFKEIGFENVTIPMICKDAKISKGTFYYHFQSKNEIIYEHVNYILANYSDILPEVLQLNSPKEQLWKLYEHSFQHIISMNDKLLKTFYIVDIANDLKRLSPSKGSSYTYSIHVFQKLTLSLIQKAQQCGEITKDFSADELSFCFMSAALSEQLDWACHGSDFDLLESLKKTFYMIFR